MFRKKGISIILSTIILISLAIIISIIVVMYFSGITETLMTIERIEVSYAWSMKGFEDYYYIAIFFKNNGRNNIIICDVSINGKSFKDFSHGTKINIGNSKTINELNINDESAFLSVEPGEIGSVGISIPSNKVSTGQTIHIMIHTINGGECYVPVTIEE